MSEQPKGKLTPKTVRKMVQSGLRRYPKAVARAVMNRPATSLGRLSISAGDLNRFTGAGLAAMWLGHGSVLLRIGGRTLLIDPVFSDRIGLQVGNRTIGLERHGPAPPLHEELPQIDAVLITHAHFDHLDRPTLRMLADKKTRVIVPRGVARLVPPGFAGVDELLAGEPAEIDGVRLDTVAPRHWGARVGFDRHRGALSYIATGRDARVVLAGDTALTRIFEGLGPVDLAALGIGAYEPWEHAHATPEQAWAMFCGMPGVRMLPVHHSTFPMSEEPVDEPMQRLLRAAGEDKQKVIEASPGSLWTP